MKYWNKKGEVEAVQWTGDNHDEINSFIGLANLPQHSKHAYGQLSVIIKAGSLGIYEAFPKDYIVRLENTLMVKSSTDFEAEYERLN